MPLLTAATFRTRARLEASVADEVFENEVALADAETLAWFGQEAYDDAIAATPTNAHRAATMKSVAFYLAWAYILPIFSLSVAGTPVQSVSLPDGTSVTGLSPSAMSAKAAAYLRLAQNLAGAYVTIPGAIRSSVVPRVVVA